MKRLTVILYILISNVAFAQQLTLEECRKMALESSYKLKSAAEQVLMMDDLLKSSKSNYLPNFSLGSNYIFSNGATTLTMAGGYLPTYITNATTGALEPNLLTVQSDGTPVFNQYAYMPDQNFELEIGSIFTANLMAEQAIYMGGKVRSGVKMRSIGGDLSKLSRRKSESEVIVDTDKAFYNAITAQKSLETALKYRELIDTLSLQMERGVEAGLKTRNDQLKVEVEQNRAQLLVLKVENLKRLAIMNLCYNIGLSLTTTDIELIDSEAEFKNITNAADITGRVEYTMLEQQIELKKANVKFVGSDFKPQLAAIASYGYANGLKLNNSTLLNKSSFVAGVTLKVPIFHFKEGRNKINAAKREVTIAENELSEMSQLMTLELTQAINNYHEAISEVELMKKSLESAEENMSVSGNMYRSGMEKLSDYLQAQTLWQEASTNLITSINRARISYIEYLKVSGEISVR